MFKLFLNRPHSLSFPLYSNYNNLHKKMRRVLSQIFSLPKPILSKYFSEDFNLDPRDCPADLLSELASRRNIKKLFEIMNKKQKNGLKLLKKLTVIHLCLAHSASYCEAFRKIDFHNLSESEWLNENIIKPYALFLNKICCSEQLYKGVTTNKIVDFTFENLFFVIKLLKSLMDCSRKITFLYHYYHKESIQRSPFLLDSFVCLLAYQAQQFYAIFKIIIAEFIRFPTKYIGSVETEHIIKYILEIQLPKLNEDMMALFLNSKFFPFGKGFGVKLFKIDDLPDQTRDYAQSIVYAERIRPKRNKKITLDSLLFDRDGKLNPQIMQGLQQISMGEDGMQRCQSILQSRIGNHISLKRRDYEENIESI